MESIIEELKDELNDLVRSIAPHNLFDDPITVERIDGIKQHRDNGLSGLKGKDEHTVSVNSKRLCACHF